ncbi:lanthionine synthetase LanC family protein [Actinacidiphila sp. DG2A-62]|uniref:lanthionine synthetase LanC family protein n=1 Tax=Actinacidiphila sp. DG2A-62 TaxID=3108821 RepID=UPI002DBBEB77|nr:lanthionine synthetase LanC family protein [Actinacidiphila sp. DG2A-62]MEC3992481.1 lanthionine synthetase LanC family protein [Actinacidiphila sp. DG2A-62]
MRIADRYTVREAIRHSARGGVFRAVDDRTGARVIVKQARAHVGAGLPGQDARDALRHEYEALGALRGVAAEPLYWHESGAHAFLVQSEVPGVPLARWVQEQRGATAGGLPTARLVELGRRLADLLGRVHARGLVFQDFTPNNIMIAADGTLTLIDAEHAAAPGALTLRAFTPGYGPPEQTRGRRIGPAFGPAVDLFALGCVLCYAATGHSPAFLPDTSPARPVDGRMALLLATAAVDDPAVRALAPAIVGLTRETPGARWPLSRLRAFLDGLAEGSTDAEAPADAPAKAPDGGRVAVRPVADVPAAPAAREAETSGTGSGHGAARGAAATANAVATADGVGNGHSTPGPDVGAGGTDTTGGTGRTGDPGRTGVTRGTAGADDAVPEFEAYGPAVRDALVADGLAHLVATMADPAGDPERLWSSGAFGRTTDPCNVQHGAAGVLATLVRADRVLDLPRVRAAAAAAGRWIGGRLDDVPRLLPGLYFGRAGTAWALYDAARHLGDEELAAGALRTALTLPVRWPNPDVCHGAAGAGFAQLHLWRATGDERFLARAQSCADGLAEAVERDGDRVFWPVPDDFDSAMAGMRHFGFAHGVAGVGAFLLAAGTATGRADLLDLAVAAGDTLAAEAERGPWGARWRDGRDSAFGQGMLYHWCSGASGVGTFLIRLWRAHGDPRFRQLAEEAGAAVRHARWVSPSATCHGLAGNGHFLLDLADAVGGPYRAWADDLAACLYTRHGLADGRRVLPDESGAEVRADHQTGLSGCVDFLLRLAHGGPRPWLADEDGHGTTRSRDAAERPARDGRAGGSTSADGVPGPAVAPSAAGGAVPSGAARRGRATSAGAPASAGADPVPTGAGA